MSILRIKSIYDNLSKTEKKIADFVLVNYEKVIYMSVSELSSLCNASEASIIRFSRRLHYKGFQDFKLSLAKENFDSSSHIYNGKVGELSDAAEIIKQIQINDLDAINNSVNLINPENIQNAADRIIQADKVDLYGIGASAFTAEYFAYMFFRIGVNSRCFSDNHLQLMSAATLTEKSVAIGITSSGGTMETVDALKSANNNGAFTIAVTNHLKSPITKFANISLITAAAETPLRRGTSTAKIAQLFVLDSLYTVAAVNIKDKAYQNMDKTAQSVINHMY